MAKKGVVVLNTLRRRTSCLIGIILVVIMACATSIMPVFAQSYAGEAAVTPVLRSSSASLSESKSDVEQDSTPVVIMSQNARSVLEVAEVSEADLSTDTKQEETIVITGQAEERVEVSELPLLMSRRLLPEQIPDVPLYYQTDYPDVWYGAYGTVASHGCGITCVAMVFSYLFDEPIMPDTLAYEYGHYNTPDGSYHSLFPDSAEDYGLTIEKTSDWQTIVDALYAGHVVIANPSECLFTDSGHFIVLYGITDDGRILVHDPNKYNYSGHSSILSDGFENGFHEDYIRYTCMPCWIYPLKEDV